MIIGLIIESEKVASRKSGGKKEITDKVKLNKLK